MNIRSNRFNSIIGACTVTLVYALGSFVSGAEAQTVASLTATRSTSSGASMTQVADPQNAELQKRVAAALQAQPYLDDRHIDVTVRGGVIVLSGIVLSDWDLQDALRTARKNAGAMPVIDSLSIQEGGR